MLLLLDGFFRGIYCRRVGYWVEDCEKAFELLNELVRQEWVVEQAILAENGARLRLPVEAFDGRSVRAHLHALQQQWEQLLQHPPKLTGRAVRQREQYLQLDAYYNRLLRHLRKQLLQDQVRESQLAQSKPDTIHVSSQENRLLERTRYLYQQTQENRRRNWYRLQALELQAKTD
ncbi:hypothetical protein [Spirosoma koreense]